MRMMYEGSRYESSNDKLSEEFNRLKYELNEMKKELEHIKKFIKAKESFLDFKVYKFIDDEQNNSPLDEDFMVNDLIMPF